MSFIKNHAPPELFITGLGVLTALGQGKAAFFDGLLQGRHGFAVMQRPGRQKESAFLGAELPALSYPKRLAPRLLRGASLSGQAALVALCEAWEEARLDDVDPERIGLVVGGSNLQQRELLQTYAAYADRPHFLRPTYGLAFMDSDLVGLCTEQFGILGQAYTVGGASASGQVAIIHALQALISGQVDVCIALGGLMDLSYMECHGLRNLGAMGSDNYADQPAAACRPFDQQRDGFIYGEACGALVIESAASLARRGLTPYARIAGWAMTMDGNRNPNPSLAGEIRAIRTALRQAGLSPGDIDYINPHGSGSKLGDETEIQAIIETGLAHAAINTTKSLTGHGLTAAGAVEVIATVLQMRAAQLHPSRNLHEPLEPQCHWVLEQAIPHVINHALTLSMGFGGVNTALCLQKV